jgi:O-antigen/teichoic acid export membrane protein
VNRRTLLTNVLSAAGQTLVQTAVMFFLYRYLIDALGIDEVGVWSVVLATSSSARVTELGLGSSVTKFVAACRARGDDRRAGELLQTAALTLALMLAVVLLVVYPLLWRLLPHVLPAAALDEGRDVLPYALMSAWLGALSGVWFGGLDGCLRSDLRAGLAILSTFVFFGLVLLLVPTRGLMGLAVSQVTQALVLAVLGWILIRHVVSGTPYVPRVWSRSCLREMLGYGANVQVITLVMLLFDPTTKVLFARYGGLSSAGYYELAQQLVRKMRALIVESNRVIVPVMAGMNEVGDDPRRLYVRNVAYLVLLLTPLFAGLAALAPLISEVWLGHYQSQFVIMTVCLTLAWYINSTTAPAYFAYMGHGRLRWLTWSHVIFGVGNGVLGLVLGSRMGWPGVMVAFCVSLAIGSLLPVWTYHHEHRITARRVVTAKDVGLIAICWTAVAIALGGYLAARHLEAGAWSRFGIVVLAGGVMGTAVWRHPVALELVRGLRRLAAGVAGSAID